MTSARKAKRVLIKHSTYLMLRKVLSGRGIYYVAGINSLFVPSRNEKYIVTHNHAGIPICREWIDLDGEIVFMSPGEAARTELRREWPDLKRVGWTSKQIQLFDWRWPMYFFGPYRGEAVYTDLVGAYHQIYSRLWLDVGFTRGFGSLDLAPVADRLKNWKQARNSLLGVTRSRVSYGWRGQTAFKLTVGNAYLSPHLWATVQSMLNEIAYAALKSGGIYCATDGYIHPTKSGVKYFHQLLVDLGIEFRSEAGDCEIVGWGNYRVASKQTQRNKISKIQGSRPFKSLELVSQNDPMLITLWWYKEVKKWRNLRRNIARPF